MKQSGSILPGRTHFTVPQTFTGTASDLNGPSGQTYAINDASADYGTLGVGATGDCDQTTGDCYLMTISGTRPATHWDATFTETLSSNSISKVRTLHLGASFADVSTDVVVYLYYPSIETIFHHQVSVGCLDGTVFARRAPTTRQEMAVFLLKQSQGTSFHTPACAGIFTRRSMHARAPAFLTGSRTSTTAASPPAVSFRATR